MTSKKMAYGVWAICAFLMLVNIISVISMDVEPHVLSVLISLISYVLIALLGYTIYRDRNDRLTMITVILVAIFTFDLGGFVAVILRLVLRKNDSENVRKLWFLPAVISAALSLIVGLSYITVLSAISMILTTLYCLIFGYWFIKYLPVN